MNLTDKKRHLLTACGIFGLAFVLRLVFDFYLRNHYPFYDYPSSDVSYYLSWARSIAIGEWERQGSFIGLPLFPHFLSLLYRLCLGNMTALRLAMMALGAANCVLIYLLANRLFNYRIALASGVLTAVSFTCIYYDRLIMPPTLLIFLSAVIMLSLLERQSFTIKHWFLIGVLLGLCLVGDGKFLFYTAFLAVYLALENRSLRHLLKMTLAPLFAGIMLILLMSGARNLFAYGEWIWISPQSGLSLFAGNNPQANGYFENMEEIRPTHFGQDTDQILMAQQETGRAMSLKEVSAHYKHKAVDFITHEPPAFLLLLGKKTLVFLQEVEASYDDLDLIFLRKLKWRLDINPVTLMLPLAALGILLSWRTPNIKLLTLLIASQLLIVLIFFFVNRFRASIFPFLIIFEVTAIDWLIAKIKAKQFIPVLSAFIFILGCLVANQPRPIDAATFDHLYLSKKGFILEQKGDAPMAMVAYRQALEIRPQDTTLLFNLGNVHLNLSYLTTAKEYYIRTIQLNALHVDAYVNLGYAYEMLREYESAIEAYTKALQLNPASTDVAFQLGVIYVNQGQCDQAQRILNYDLRAENLLQAKFRPILNTCINK